MDIRSDLLVIISTIKNKLFVAVNYMLFERFLTAHLLNVVWCSYYKWFIGKLCL